MSSEQPSLPRNDADADARRDSATRRGPRLAFIAISVVGILALGLAFGWWAANRGVTSTPVAIPPAGSSGGAPESSGGAPESSGAAGAVAPAAAAVAPAAAGSQVVMYVRAGCPHCADAKTFLETLQREQPELVLSYRDVVDDATARADLEALVKARGLTAVSVPVIVVGPSTIVGYVDDETTGAQIRAALAGQTVATEDTFGSCSAEGDAGGVTAATAVSVPLIGAISASSLGMPVFTTVLGLADGFNPCAMWVLLFLLSMLINLNDRRKMVLVAGTFVVVSGVVYLAFMAAWLGVFMVIGYSRSIQLVLGMVALTVGLLNVKDFFAFGRGFSISIPDSRKPEIYRRTRNILRADNIFAMILGVAALAVMVNLVELLCTAGLPAVYTQVLSSLHLPQWQYYGYLVMYIVFYMIDDAIMVGIAVVTLSQGKLQERGGRALKLVSGAVMVLLSIMLIFKPEWLAALG